MKEVLSALAAAGVFLVVAKAVRVGGKPCLTTG